jgi:hypothetical protein
MSSAQLKKGTGDLPTQVFEEFLQALNKADVPPELIARLGKTILEQKVFTEAALRAAILEEEPLS